MKLGNLQVDALECDKCGTSFMLCNPDKSKWVCVGCIDKAMLDSGKVHIYKENVVDNSTEKCYE